LKDFRLLNPNPNITYLTNTNRSHLFIYNIQLNKIKKIPNDQLETMKIEVIGIDNDDNQVETIRNFKEILKSNVFISIVEVVSSTTKKSGFYTITDEFGINKSFLNEFVGSDYFIKSQINLNKEHKNFIPMVELEKNAPNINILLKNLFFNESNEVIENFLCWLKTVSFEDKNQDIIFNFSGTNEQNQGQGSGKGVLIQLLNELFNGLTTSVNNQSYKNNFNAHLQNKKIVVFDEVDYKKLNYNVLKDITGNKEIKIESKGKDTITSKNVSSWLMFSNEWDFCNIFTIDDRRIFLIRPNPKNGSLKSIVGDTFQFIEDIKNEIPQFIEIISKVGSKVLSPNELQTNTHKEYYRSKSKVSITEIKDLHKVLLNENVKEKIIQLFVNIKDIDSSKITKLENVETVLNFDCISYKSFKDIFESLQDFGYLQSSLKVNKEWEIVKENLLVNSYEEKRIGLKRTKTFGSYDDKILIKEEVKQDKYKEIIKTIRPLYSTKGGI